MNVIRRALSPRQPVRPATRRPALLPRAAAGLGLCCTPLAAVGQTAAETEAQTLEQVIVYGARNARTIDETAASVGLLDADAIQDAATTSFRDSFRLLANVMDSDWNDAGFVIRGVGSEGLTPGKSPLASFYVDGVLQTVDGTRRGARGLFDVEQVEVYRGPQSTLSGRAALAGAIYLKTVDPSFTRSASRLQATVGADDRLQAAAAFGGVLVSDQLAWRISAEYDRKDSDLAYPNYAAFERYDDFTTDVYYQLRAKLLYVPAGSPDTRVLLSLSGAHDSPTQNDIVGRGFGTGIDFSARRGDFNQPVFSEDREADNYVAGLTITHDFGTGLEFTSNTGLADTWTDRSSVNEGTPGQTLVSSGDLDMRTLTQELRLNYARGALSAVAGLYFAWEDNAGYRDRLSSATRRDVLISSDEADTQALFGELTYEFSPGWKLTGGLRAERSELTVRSTSLRNGATLASSTLDSTEDVLLPKLGLVRELGDHHSLHLTAQRGYRSGGAGVNAVIGQYSYDPEFANNFELGWRGAFLERRLSVAVNVFDQIWRDQQVEVFVNPLNSADGRYTTNAAKSESRGAELDWRFDATPALSLFGAFGYVHTRFDEFIDASRGNFSGLPFPEAPELNAVVGLHYEHASGTFAGFDAKYVDGYYSRIEGNAAQYLTGEVDSRTVVNASLGRQFDALRLTVYAQNLFDEDYFTYVYRFGLPEAGLATIGPRREVGLRADWRF